MPYFSFRRSAALGKNHGGIHVLEKDKELPRIPIKTYQWEDVRRSRKRGGYPWTHLTKPAFDGEEDPEEYTLEAYRRSRSRSTSTIGKARSESASTFGDRSPSPSGGNEDSRDHSRTPSTIQVEHQSSGKKSGTHSTSQRSSVNFNEDPSTFTSRYERSKSPPSNIDKFERSQSLNRDVTTRAFERSKSPSRSFSENKTDSPPNQRRSRSPTKKNNINSSSEQTTSKMETDNENAGGSKEEPRQEQASPSDSKSEPDVRKPSEEILESPEQPKKPSAKLKREGNSESKRKLKRRLSVQSSYSRISLTKQSILDRIKSTRKSLKISRPVKRSKSDVTYEKKPVNTKGRKSIDATKHPEKPVYIHIPLKPPPGQTDEYSYLEFEENPPPLGQATEKRGGKKEVFGDDRDGSPIVGVILEFDDPDKKDRISQSEMDHIISKIGNGASVQQIDAKDLFPEISEQSAKIKEIVHSMEDKAKIVATNGSEVLEEVEVKDKKEALEKIKQVENGSVNQEDMKSETPTSDILKTPEEITQMTESSGGSKEPIRLGTTSLQKQDSDRLIIQEMSSREGSITPDPTKPVNKPIIFEPDEDNISQYLDRTDEPMEIVTEKSETSKTGNDNENASQKVEPFKVSDLNVPNQRKGRARSEEPSTRKRKLSADSSYSRKSLSKLAFLKKIKNFTDKILPSFGKADKKDDENTEPDPQVKKEKEIETKKEKELKNKKNKRKSLETPKTEEPKYIYIPLKPPEGETDEFSKFAEEPLKDTNGGEKQLDRRDTETSEDAPLNNIQIIILTPPSDDEILDSNSPETPSESDQKFFDNVQIDNLKSLAKKVVDEVYPEARALQTVQEESFDSQEKLASDEQRIATTTEQVMEDSKSESKEEKEKLSDILPSNEDVEENETEKAKQLNKLKDAQGPQRRNLEEEKIVLQERILVDEEDGLKLNEIAVAMINEELAKEGLEKGPQEESAKPNSEDATKVKKRVLFKKKKRTDDGEYEDVNIPDSQRNSMEVGKQDEDKIKEDVELVKKLENGSSVTEGKKWSKIDDHEYEPINPPPDEMAHVSSPPQIHVTGPQQQGRLHNAPYDSALSSTTSLERQYLGAASGDEDLSAREADIHEAAQSDKPLTPQELQTQIEERFFAATTPETADSRKDGEPDTDAGQVDSHATDTLPDKKESKKKEKSKPDGQQGGKFNEALKHQAESLRNQAGKIKSKFQNLKKPSISLPQRPKFQTPTFKMSKIGDHAKIHLPTFKKSAEKQKQDWQQERQYSTESNVGEPKKHFDFSTFPKLFDRHKKGRKTSLDDFEATRNTEEETVQLEFATMPKVSRKKGPVGSRWANKFKDIEYADESQQEPQEERPKSVRISLHEDNEEIPIDSSHIRFNEDLDDEYDQENKEIHKAVPFNMEHLKRWEHGEFHEGPSPQIDNRNDQDQQVTDLDAYEPQTPPELGLPPSNGIHSSGSLSDHRRGVIEEIDSDEFFLREKGISQENIEVGKYLSSEIREAFRNPVNSLTQIERNGAFEGEFDVSDQSLQEPPPRKKPARKSKRKKTPHVSQENVSFDQDSVTEPEEYHTDIRTYPPPARPKRKGKSRKPKRGTDDHIVPYQETIPVDDEGYDLSHDLQEKLKTLESDILPDNILSPKDTDFDDTPGIMYENEHMMGIEQPEIMVSDPYSKTETFPEDVNGTKEHPAPPPRKHRSLKSLDVSEHDSILDDSSAYKDTPREEIEAYREHEYIIPTPEPPVRSKKIRSRSQSQTISQLDDDRTSRGGESLTSENLVPVVEEICVKDIRDNSGYAIIDKQKCRDPPLPPSRFPPSPPKKRKNKNIEKTKVVTEIKFFTVPRSQPGSAPPERPSRNYSTLGSPTKPVRKKSTSTSGINTDEKENIDISQYIEIEEPVKRLQSGEVLQKMRDRPLPPPPRPPRRQRDGREALQDITNGENRTDDVEEKDTFLDETEVSTQTEPLPDDFVCEPLEQEVTDRIIVPSEEKKAESPRRRESFEETVTHGSLVVQPIDNAQILPYSSLHRKSERQERVIPVKYEDYDEETSEIPEDFKNLKSPEIPVPAQQIIGEKKTPLHDPTAEVEFLKTQKLQVGDLDVDRLRVNELQASKIMVSEIEGFSIQVNEINSRAGNLVVSGIELPPLLLQELLDRLQSAARRQEQPEGEQSVSHTTETESTLKDQQSLPSDKQTQDDNGTMEQKKTTTEFSSEEKVQIETEESNQFPNSQRDKFLQNLEHQKQFESEHFQNLEIQEDESEHLQNLENQQLLLDQQLDEGPPKRPPRKSSVASTSQIQETEEDNHSVAAPNENISSSTQALPSSNNSASASSLKDSSSDLIGKDNENIVPLAVRTDEEPPPRPPQPEYIPSQPPASFYALRSRPYSDILAEAIPMPPRRKRHIRSTALSRSSSEDNPSPPRRQRSPSIPELTGQLVRACTNSAEQNIKRLIAHFSENVLRNKDGKQDSHVMIIILLVLIAGILLLTGDPKVTIHHHHWEYFNPPRDL